MQRLGPPKEEEKELHWVSLNVLATGLSLCAEQRVDFVQEMGDNHPIRSQTITQQISSLVLICDAKTRFHRKKGIGNVVSVWNVSAIGLSL